MEYLVLIYRDETREAEVDQAKRGQKYERYAQALVQAGVMRGGQKLQTSNAATTVTERAGNRVFANGPAIAGNEQLGGYFILECADLNEAVSWASLCPGAADGTVEVRPVSA